MLDLIKKHWTQIALVLGVFALFIANAVGVFELLLDIHDTSSSLTAVLHSREFAILLGVGVILSVALPVLSPIKASILTLIATVPVFYVGYLPSPQRSLIPLEYSLLTILMLFVVNVLFSYFSESHKKQKLIQAFSQYVPTHVVAELSHDPDKLALEGEAREMSVMFCDVHNFTGISEELSPRQLARLLNTLFTPLTEVLYKHNATIDKYIGDAIMAFWGAPIDDPDHARNALAAALELQDAVTHLGTTFRQQGWPELTVGIGINTGVMSVGNMGSKYRMAYTVIGDAVNLASRLQELTRVFKTGIIVGEQTRKAFPGGFYRELGLVQVKGKQALARIYEPSNPSADPESTMVENMNRHNKALKHYYAREWDAAEALFLELGERRKDDPLYPHYLERIADYRVSAPSPQWAGQVEFTIK